MKREDLIQKAQHKFNKNMNFELQKFGKHEIYITWKDQKINSLKISTSYISHEPIANDYLLLNYNYVKLKLTY